MKIRFTNSFTTLVAPGEPWTIAQGTVMTLGKRNLLSVRGDLVLFADTYEKIIVPSCNFEVLTQGDEISQHELLKREYAALTKRTIALMDELNYYNDLVSELHAELDEVRAEMEEVHNKIHGQR